jgi:hypothetical protein
MEVGVGGGITLPAIGSETYDSVLCLEFAAKGKLCCAVNN